MDSVGLHAFDTVHCRCFGGVAFAGKDYLAVTRFEPETKFASFVSVKFKSRPINACTLRITAAAGT